MKLIKTETGNYRVVHSNYSFEGNWSLVYAHLVHELELDASEVAAAVDEMRTQNSDTALFGINGTFMYCEDSQAIDNIAAELKAIQSLRKEFNEAYQKDPGGALARDAFNRLASLYFAFNAGAVLKVLEVKAVA